MSHSVSRGPSPIVNSPRVTQPTTQPPTWFAGCLVTRIEHIGSHNHTSYRAEPRLRFRLHDIKSIPNQSLRSVQIDHWSGSPSNSPEGCCLFNLHHEERCGDCNTTCGAGSPLAAGALHGVPTDINRLEVLLADQCFFFAVRMGGWLYVGTDTLAPLAFVIMPAKNRSTSIDPGNWRDAADLQDRR